MIRILTITTNENVYTTKPREIPAVVLLLYPSNITHQVWPCGENISTRRRRLATTAAAFIVVHIMNTERQGKRERERVTYRRTGIEETRLAREGTTTTTTMTTGTE